MRKKLTKAERKAETKRKDEWDKENITRMVIKPRKEEAQAIKDFATSKGMSTQAFILSAIREAMSKGKAKFEG